MLNTNQNGIWTYVQNYGEWSSQVNLPIKLRVILCIVEIKDN
jgi:hypothetical protein